MSENPMAHGLCQMFEEIVSPDTVRITIVLGDGRYGRTMFKVRGMWFVPRVCKKKKKKKKKKKWRSLWVHYIYSFITGQQRNNVVPL
jgi:hypothetical protein